MCSIQCRAVWQVTAGFSDDSIPKKTRSQNIERIFGRLDTENPTVTDHRGIFGRLDSENGFSGDSIPKITRSQTIERFSDDFFSKVPLSLTIEGFSGDSIPKMDFWATRFRKWIFGRLDTENPTVTDHRGIFGRLDSENGFSGDSIPKMDFRATRYRKSHGH